MSRVLVKASNLAWELRLGISTRGSEPENGAGEYTPYGTVPYAAVNAILARLELQPSDVFVDVGCGKGRAICCAARSIVREVVGVDMSPELLAIARANVASLRRKRSPARLVLSLAEEFDYSGVTAVYLFNPFGARTLRTVLCKLQHAAQERGDIIRIAYAYPVHESVFREQQSWLEEIDRWEPFTVFAQRCAVSFWRSRTQAAR